MFLFHRCCFLSEKSEQVFSLALYPRMRTPLLKTSVMATRVVVSISAMSTKKESQASFENKRFSEIILEQCYPNMSICDVQGCHF